MKSFFYTLALAALFLPAWTAAAPLRIVDATRGGIPHLSGLLYACLQKNPGLSFQMRHLPAKAAAEGVKKGEFDLVIMEKRDAALFADAALEMHPPFALQAVTVSVHPDLPLSAITHEQLKKLLSEPLPKWSLLLPDSPHDVHLFTLKPTAPSAGFIDALIFGDRIVSRGKAFRADSSKMLLQLTALDPSSLAVAFYLANPPAMVKHLQINGVPPTEENLKKGLYPLTTFFCTVSPRQSPAAPAIRIFLNFLKSDDARLLLKAGESLPL